MSDQRRGRRADSTAERRWTPSTHVARDLSGGRASGAKGERPEYPEDTVARDHRGVDPTPRRYDES